ncbi:MAG: efflux RND transporter permease subunit [Phycisphaerae bacterium]
MAGNSVAANLAMLVCLIGGLLAMWNVKQEVFPDIELDVVRVSVVYPSASPEEVEDGILLSIEEAVQGLEGVKEVISTANEGRGTVSIEALSGVDVDKLARDVESEVDRIDTFPEDAEEPEVETVVHDREVLSVMVYGGVDERALRRAANDIRDELLNHEGITKAEVGGVRDLEISVDVPIEQLRRYGLTLGEIADRVRAAALDVPGGGVKTSGGEILVRVKERREYGKEFARLPIITTSEGTEVLLGQIATKITDGFEDTDRSLLYNGQRAAEVEVYRVGDQTPMEVAAAVREKMPDVRDLLPPGVQTDIYRDRSDIYTQRVNLLMRNMGLGLLLVLVVLGLFLEVRLAFWVMMGIPISFLASFLLLPMFDVTINMISLFAYIIALGIVVDDAIVVGENTYHYHQEGLPFHIAAVKGAREVAVPVTFSILTNMVTFLPIYFIPGVMGNVFRMIPVVVCVVFAISLLECLFVLPAHLSHQKDRKRRGLSKWLHGRQQAFGRAFTGWVRKRYGPVLEQAMVHRYVTIAGAAALLIAVGAFAMSGRMGFSLFPKIESDFSQGSVVLPYGAPVEDTEDILERMRKGALKVIEESGHPELKDYIITDIGRSGSHTGQVRVGLADPDIRSEIMSTEEFTQRWRKAVGEIAGVESLKFASDVGGPGGRGAPVTVELSHRDIDLLANASAELARQLDQYPRLKDVDDGFQPGKKQFDFRLLPQGKSLGLTARSIARQVRNAFYGIEAVSQQRGRDEIEIMVRLPEEQRISEQDIDEFLVRTPAGTFVPLREVAQYERGRAYTVINRKNGRRVVQVQADVTPRSKAGEVLADLKTSVLPELTSKYGGLSYSFEGHQADMRESLGSLRTSFIIAMLVIYGMLAIPFRSYIQPLIVMISIPFGIIGAVIGHLIMGYDLAIPSMFGIVALSGVVVNDSLVLIDFANRRRKEGMDPHDAIVSAAIQRFRPILLTTLTTFGGLAPMIFETSRQARFLVPMAISLGFGLLFATFITLGLVPALYLAIEDLRRRLKRTWQWLYPPRPEREPTTEPVGAE